MSATRGQSAYILEIFCKRTTAFAPRPKLGVRKHYWFVAIRRKILFNV
jgi:hypothetical protein